MKLKLLIFLGITGIFISMVTYQSAKFFDNKLHVIFCDVGQGDAIYIRTPSGEDLIIDGGPNDDVLDCLADHRPFWDRTIELVLLTHPHADHITGLTDVLRRFTVYEFATQPSEHTSDIFHDLTDLIHERHILERMVHNHDRYIFPDDVQLTVLWPQASQKSMVSDDLNEDSVVVLLEYRDFKALLTGDADTSVVNPIIDWYPELTILKLAHHGSKTSTDMETFDRNKPDYAVFTVGSDNRYGHPSKSVLDVLDHYQIAYKRTDRDGAIEVVSDGYTTRLITNN